MRVGICLLVTVFFLIGNVLYAANGDLLVKGNAGIGTISPKGRLDVKGPAIAEGMIQTMGYVDLAKGVTPSITPGSTLAGGGPTFKGMWTYWDVTTFPSSLTLDLAPAPEPQGIMYICFGTSWRQGITVPKDYSIEYSMDGTSWNTLAVVQNYSGQYVIHNANGISARYIRLNVLAPQVGQTHVYVAGLQVLSSQGPATLGDNPWAFSGYDSFIAIPGNVGIGTSRPAYKLDVAGTIATNGSPITSDVRFKKNIEPIADSLTKVLKLDGVSYEWKTEEYADKGFEKGRHYGVIAQEIEKVLPDVVNTRPDGSKNVAYTEIIPVLIEAIKEQQKQIEQLKDELRDLRNRDSH